MDSQKDGGTELCTAEHHQSTASQPVVSTKIVSDEQGDRHRGDIYNREICAAARISCRNRSINTE